TVAPNSAPYILRLLLLAELFVHSTPRPALSPTLCGLFGSMVHQVENLMNISKRLHELSSDELPDFDGVEHKLHLPHIQHTASHLNSLKSAEGASTHLRHLSNIIKTSLQQLSIDVPQSPTPSLPTVPSTAFDVLKLSIELSERLQVFSDWSKRVLRHLQRQSRCPRR
ncbi:hypothetical protein INR49_006491, partial [Caranx melampygus]